MAKISESGIHSVSFRNALAYAKRKATKEMYSFTELVEDAKVEYTLTAEETEALTKKLVAYCKKNYLYTRSIQRMEDLGYI